MKIDKFQALLDQALEYHHQGQLSQAEGCYHSLLRLSPGHADVLHLLGVLTQQQGNPEASLPLIKAAIQKNPTNSIFHLNLGHGFFELGRFDDAIQCYQQALILTPDLVESHNGLGNALLGKKCYEQAIAAFNQALAVRPDYKDAHLNLAIAYWKNRDIQQARTLLGLLLQEIPNYSNGWNTLGLVCQEEGRMDEAIESFEKALYYDSSFFQSRVNLGIAYKHIGSYEQAIACYLKALESQPTNPEVFYNLGIVMQDCYRFDDAVLCYQQALSFNPELSEVWNNLAYVLKDIGRLDEALSGFQKALQFRQQFPQAINGLLSVKLSLCNWDGLSELIEHNLSLVRSTPSARITPFSFLSIESTAQDQLFCAQKWVKNTLKSHSQVKEIAEFSSSKACNTRIRVGYLSADFHEHATAYLISELFELHDRQDFEVYVYSYGPDDGSAIRERIASACDNFIDLRTFSDLEAVRKIRADSIDILIDLKGHTKDARDQLLSHRLAPVQVNWLGYPGTMGADFIDYIIADNFIIPAGADHCYEEKVVRLPDCYQINDRKRKLASHIPTREECGLPATGLVFCSFNQGYKIQPNMFDVWMSILRTLPDSVLWLLAVNKDMQENLKKQAQARGVAGERLVFAAKKSLAEHLPRYHLADLCLDTFPVTSHTTASDALWMGCPLVTCVGKTFVSRVAGSLLQTIGLSELITENLEDYQSRVLELAHDPARLHDIRSKLQINRNSSALFDSPRFVVNLERAFRMMWENYCKGNPPKAINL